MDYGFEINDILGMDFLIRAKAIINLADMKMDFADSLYHQATKTDPLKSNIGYHFEFY